MALLVLQASLFIDVGGGSCDTVVSPLEEEKGLAKLLQKATKMSRNPRNSFEQLRRKETESILPKRAPAVSGIWRRRDSVVLQPQRGSHPARADAHPQPEVLVRGAMGEGRHGGSSVHCARDEAPPSQTLSAGLGPPSLQGKNG